MANISSEELLIEFKPDVFLCFANSTALSAHCLWAFGAPSGKVQNQSLHETISSILTHHLGIPSDRVRITRVQLYEIVDHTITTGQPSVHKINEITLSPERKKKFLESLSPRQKDKKEKKGFSKSLERKKAAELTAQKQKQLSVPGVDVKKDTITAEDDVVFNVDGFKAALADSSDSDASITALMGDKISD